MTNPKKGQMRNNAVDPMSDAESKRFIKSLIGKGDPKMKPMKKPLTKKEVRAIIQGQLDLIKNNPKFREKLLGKSALEMQKKMNAKFGKDH